MVVIVNPNVIKNIVDVKRLALNVPIIVDVVLV
jgi:hypothetical protein